VIFSTLGGDDPMRLFDASLVMMEYSWLQILVLVSAFFPLLAIVNINFSKLIVALHSEDIFSATVGS